jgi:hypothetical protein
MFGDHGKVQQQNTSEVEIMNTFLPYTFTYKVMDGNKLQTNWTMDRMLPYVAFVITPKVLNQGFLSVTQHCTAMAIKSIFRINTKKINIQQRHKTGKFFLHRIKEDCKIQF